jgi:hypothetical protein
MALKIFYQEDIESAVLAGMVLAIRTAAASGKNVEYMRGIAAAFEFQALAFGLSWPAIVAEVRGELGAQFGLLIEKKSQAVTCGRGNE